jgi:hypothetical protein
MTFAEKILDSTGPLMSSDLSYQIHKDYGIKINTASQQLSRDKSILKIKGFYSSQQSFCYLDKHLKENHFFDVLLNSMFKHGRKYWYCLNAIKINGGILNKKYLECLTNYPIQPLSSHIPFDKVMQNFIKNGILIFDANYYMVAPRLNQKHIGLSHYKTIELIKEDILKNFHTLTKNIGLISFKTGEVFSEFGKFKWSFKGLCTLNGLKVNETFGYLLADILFGHSIRKDDIKFFLEKIKTIQSFKNASKIFPILIVDDLNPQALNLLKKNGIIIGFVKELFGQKYADTLKELVNVLNNAGASLKKDPNKYLNLIAELKKYNEGLANNIKGALFEFVIGHIHSLDSNSSIDIGREIFSENGKHEIDVLAIYNDKIVFAECKATKSQIDEQTIDKWKGRKIPAFREWAKKQDIWKDKKLEFEYWSISGFDQNAQIILNNLIKTSSQIKVSYYSGNDLRLKTLKMKNRKLKEAVDNYFLKTIV